MNKIDQAITTLLSCSGLETNQAKLAIYYAIGTWTLSKLSMFPILRFNGPPGTGKSSAIAVITPWCLKPHAFSGKLITPPALRGELKKAYMGTAMIEADDEKVKMYYTIPVLYDSIVQETTGVLPFVHHG